MVTGIRTPVQVGPKAASTNIPHPTPSYSPLSKWAHGGVEEGAKAVCECSLNMNQLDEKTFNEQLRELSIEVVPMTD